MLPAAQLVILGVSTTAVYHTMILDLPSFKSGDIDTGFIPKHATELQDPPPPIRVRTSRSASAADAVCACLLLDLSPLAFCHLLVILIRMSKGHPNTL